MDVEFGNKSRYNFENVKEPKFLALATGKGYLDFAKHCLDPRFMYAAYNIYMSKLAEEKSKPVIGIRQFNHAIANYEQVFNKYCVPGKFRITPFESSKYNTILQSNEINDVVTVKKNELSEFQKIIQESLPNFDPIASLVGDMNYNNVAMTGGMAGGLNRLAEIDGEDILKGYCEQAKMLNDRIINVDASKVQDAIVAYYQKPLMSFNAYFNNNSFVEIIYNALLYRNAINKIHNSIQGDNKYKKLIDLLTDCMTVVDGANVKSYDKVENNVYKHPGHEFEGVHVREGEDDLTFKAYSKLHKYNQFICFSEIILEFY
jgi:hypothetical protein